VPIVINVQTIAVEVPDVMAAAGVKAKETWFVATEFTVLTIVPMAVLVQAVDEATHPEG